MSAARVLRRLVREVWDGKDDTLLSDATLSNAAREQRSREDAHAHAVHLAKECGGPAPLIVESYRVISTAVYELERQAKQPKPREIRPIQVLRRREGA